MERVPIHVPVPVHSSVHATNPTPMPIPVRLIEQPDLEKRHCDERAPEHAGGAQPPSAQRRSASSDQGQIRAEGSDGAEGLHVSDSPCSKLACQSAVLASISPLQLACKAVHSEGMLVALGAQITLSELVAGRTAHRLRKACLWLRGWCERAEAGPCSPSSLIFLLSSWAEAKKVDGNSDWFSFLSGKAFANRLAFHDQLLTLLSAQEEGDGIRYPPRGLDRVAHAACAMVGPN